MFKTEKDVMNLRFPKLLPLLAIVVLLGGCVFSINDYDVGSHFYPVPVLAVNPSLVSSVTLEIRGKPCDGESAVAVVNNSECTIYGTVFYFYVDKFYAGYWRGVFRLDGVLDLMYYVAPGCEHVLSLNLIGMIPGTPGLYRIRVPVFTHQSDLTCPIKTELFTLQIDPDREHDLTVEFEICCD